MTRRGMVLAGLFVLAIVVRVGHLAALLDEPLLEFHRVYVASDMYLFDQWARHIGEGDWLGRVPYHPLAPWQLEAAPEEKWRQWYGETPVYFKAPFYAYLLALLQRAFGDAMVPVALLQILASAIAVILVAVLTERTFGWEAGVFAGLLFALYAPAIHYDAVMLRGPWIVLASLVVTWQLLRLREVPSAARATLLGVALGLALLVNEGFSILPVLLLPLLPWRDERTPALRLAGGIAGGMLLALTPLIVRNLLVGAPPFSLAVTGGMTYALCNSPESAPFFGSELGPHVVASILERASGSLPRTAIACLRSFSGPGEVLRLYGSKLLGLVVPFEGPDNSNVYYAALVSPLLRWLPGYGVLFALATVGLASLRSRWRQALVWLPGAAALLASMILTEPASRYRTTFAVFLFPFAGLACASWLGALRLRRWDRAVGMAASALAIGFGALLLQREVVFAHRPIDAYRYRPAEFALSTQVYEGRHEVGAAARELQLLIRLNPRRSDKINAYLKLAEMAAVRGEGPAARAALANAAWLGAGDAGAMLAIGDAHLMLLHDREGALASYRGAQLADREGRLGSVLRQRIDHLQAAESQP